jgi:hypothetical protein
VPTYSTKDFEHIAASIGVGLLDVIQYRNAFEAAATWYRADCRRPRRVPPSTIRRQARLIAGAAKKLLRHLEIYDYRKAFEGPPDWALLEALASAEEGTEDDVIRATERVGRLAEIFNAIDAAQELERRGRNAADDAAKIGRLTTPVGRRGEDAMNAWIAEIMGIYKTLTGKEPRISQVASGPNRGKPSGPFFRFLEAARRPVEFEGKPLRPRAVRERVRAIRAGARFKK